MYRSLKTLIAFLYDFEHVLKIFEKTHKMSSPFGTISEVDILHFSSYLQNGWRYTKMLWYFLEKHISLHFYTTGLCLKGIIKLLNPKIWFSHTFFNSKFYLQNWRVPQPTWYKNVAKDLRIPEMYSLCNFWLYWCLISTLNQSNKIAGPP